MVSVARDCHFCGQYAKAEVSENRPPVCPRCQKSWPVIPPGFSFESCPFCDCRQFYVQKDFNQAGGCLIMLLGILLVPVTYGISLPVFALIDWALYKKVSALAVCYRCGGEFRGFSIPGHFKGFMHHIGEKYEREQESGKAKNL